MDWHDRYTSIHEAGHAVTARYFGLQVELATLDYVDVAWSCTNEMLVMSAAGDAATTCFLNWTATGAGDDRLARVRLKRLGVGFWTRRRLMRRARQHAMNLVRQFKPQIFSVADALVLQRTLTQSEIDALL